MSARPKSVWLQLPWKHKNINSVATAVSYINYLCLDRRQLDSKELERTALVVDDIEYRSGTSWSIQQQQLNWMPQTR